MKKLLLTITLLLGLAAAVKADVTINATNFPDANFRAWVLAQDYGTDGKLTNAEIASVTSIDVANKSIADLTGIGYFTALTTLDCTGNQLTTLNLSKNTALTELYCDNNLIRGEYMTALVESLPDRSATSAAGLYVYDNEIPMGNMMTTVQVAAAKAKNWMPKQNVDGE